MSNYTTKEARTELASVLNVTLPNDIGAKEKIFEAEVNGESCIFVCFAIVHRVSPSDQRYIDINACGKSVLNKICEAWKKARKEQKKFFFFALNHQDTQLAEYIFSVEANPENLGNATQYITANQLTDMKEKNFACSKRYPSRNAFVSIIRKECLKQYIDIFDTRTFNTMVDTDETHDSIVNRHRFGINRLFYGVPGCGKSFTVDKETENMHWTRVVFHPDYTYSDFVGQILPKVNPETEKIEYQFTPGPFTQILKYAEKNPGEKCCLIIEELNRGNAPAIFGELFQLLDRSEEEKNFGESKYGVFNYDVADEVYGDGMQVIKIPSNLSIYATMNTSDQNVFTLDTAFQRRWFMTYIPNNFKNEHAADRIEQSNLNWGAFATVVNEARHDSNSGFSSTEDKSLGAYFATKTDLSKQRFAQKVLKYIWDDAFKFDREKIFKEEIKSFEKLMEKVSEENGDFLKKILLDNVYAKMQSAVEKYDDFGKDGAPVAAGHYSKSENQLDIANVWCERQTFKDVSQDEMKSFMADLDANGLGLRAGTSDFNIDILNAKAEFIGKIMLFHGGESGAVQPKEIYKLLAKAGYEKEKGALLLDGLKAFLRPAEQQVNPVPYERENGYYYISYKTILEKKGEFIDLLKQYAASF